MSGRLQAHITVCGFVCSSRVLVRPKINEGMIHFYYLQPCSNWCEIAQKASHSRFSLLVNGCVAVTLIIQHSPVIASVFGATLNPHQLFVLFLYFLAEQQCLTQFPLRVGRVMAAGAALENKKTKTVLQRSYFGPPIWCLALHPIECIISL